MRCGSYYSLSAAQWLLSLSSYAVAQVLVSMDNTPSEISPQPSVSSLVFPTTTDSTPNFHRPTSFSLHHRPTSFSLPHRPFSHHPWPTVVVHTYSPPSLPQVTSLNPTQPPPYHPHGHGQPLAAIAFEIMGGIIGLILVMGVLHCAYKWRKTPPRDRIAGYINRHRLQQEMVGRAYPQHPHPQATWLAPPPPYLPPPPKYQEAAGENLAATVVTLPSGELEPSESPELSSSLLDPTSLPNTAPTPEVLHTIEMELRHPDATQLFEESPLAP